MNKKVSLILTFLCAVFTACSSEPGDFDNQDDPAGTDENVIFFDDFNTFNSSV